MIPFGSETVTLVQRIEDTINGKKHITYRTAKLSGCSWRLILRHNREGEVLASCAPFPTAYSIGFSGKSLG